MADVLDKVTHWIDAHGVLAQIKRSYHINNLVADIENLRRENLKLRSENKILQQVLGSD